RVDSLFDNCLPNQIEIPAPEDARSNLDRVRYLLWKTMQKMQRLGPYGSTPADDFLEAAKLIEEFVHRHFQRTVQHQTETALVRMFAQEHDRTIEMRIRRQWRRYQQFPGRENESILDHCGCVPFSRSLSRARR